MECTEFGCAIGRDFAGWPEEQNLDLRSRGESLFVQEPKNIFIYIYIY